ncbi:MAG TPA: AAA family ATPase [Bacteroidaceae bacterium]|nr:AAA family ATPase [Bacteroidaceae bacterium]
MAKSRFRIIALRPITPKDVTDEELKIVKSIQKKVFGSSWLYFYRGYELKDTLDSKNGELEVYGYQLKVSQSVFDDSILYDQDDVCISIGAIVGPNGSGKSSMIELIIRILNNLSVAAKGEIVNHSAAEHLFFIENVYGCIVLQENDRYIQIKVAGRSVSAAIYQWDEKDNIYICDQPLELLSEEAKSNRFMPIKGSWKGMQQLYNMFYTAIFNYSLYSFNYKDYYNERTIENRWHNVKNDDNCESYFKEDFNENQVWLKGLFHKNDGYQTPIVLNPMRDNGIINVPKENHLTNERLLNNLFFKNDKLHDATGSPIFPFRLINDHLEIVALKITHKDNPKFSKDNLFTSLDFRDNALTRNFEKIRNEMCVLWSKAYCMTYSEKTPHEKLAWDYVIYKTLKIIKTYDKYKNVRRDLIYFKNFNADSVYKHFCNMLQDESHVTLKLRQALTFLKYKIFRENNSSIIILKEAYSLFMKVQDEFKEMNWRIDEESGYITANLLEGYTIENIPKIEFKGDDLLVNIPSSYDYTIPYFFLDKEGSLNVRIPDYEEAILPPIFDIEPMLIEKTLINEDGSFDKKNLIPMSGLSSGEKQIAGSISNMVYHLANINSVWQDKNLIKLTQYKQPKKVYENQGHNLLKYKYVNIVFDEVELYFHPDLQRRFVKNILDALKNLNLEYIEGINIMLVTHSPFVLSDLPRTNVLALNNQQSDIEETFCANIHEMLGNSFFMTYSMGDVAREQIEMVFDIYNRFKRGEKIIIEEREWKKFQYIASKVSDEYLGKLVKSMLEEMQPLIDPEKELNRQIEEVENKLKELMARKEAQK